MVKVIISDVKRDELEESLLKKTENDSKYITLYPISMSESVKRGGDNLPGTLVLDTNVNDEGARNINLHAVVTGDADVNYSAFRASLVAVSAYAQSESVDIIIISAGYLMSLGMDELEVAAVCKELLINSEIKVIVCTKMIDEDYETFDSVHDDSKDRIVNEIGARYGKCCKKKDNKKGKKNKKKKRK